jgi:hypothetical protein
LPETDEDEDWDEEEALLKEAKREKAGQEMAANMLDIFSLDFTGDKPVTQNYPYIVSR